MLVSHCTSSPRQLRRGRHRCTVFTFRGLAVHAPLSISHFRKVSLLTRIPSRSLRYSAASVGPKSPYSLRYKRTARSRCLPPIRRWDGFPFRPCTTARSPCFRTRFTNSRTHRSLSPNCSAAARCLRCPCLTSCKTFNRSLCFCVSNNCSCSWATSQLCPLQPEVSTLPIQELLTLPRHARPP